MSDETGQTETVTDLPVSLVFKLVIEQIDYPENFKKCLWDSFKKVEEEAPGLGFDLLEAVIRKEGLGTSAYAVLLKSWWSEDNSLHICRTEEEFALFNDRVTGLKSILSRFPACCSDKNSYYKFVKSVASSIKDLVDDGKKINEKYVSTEAMKEVKRILAACRKDFVKYSKYFSNSVKQTIKEPRPELIYPSLILLVNQLNMTINIYKEI